MADLKKIPFSTINDEIITMDFDENPNIPTANYSDETLIAIQESIKKQMKANKVKQLIESELKEKDKKEDNDLNVMFSFKGM